MRPPLLIVALVIAVAPYAQLSRAAEDPAARDWPMLGHDAARSGATPAEIGPPFERKWYRAFPEEGIMTGVQPVVAGGKCFVGTLRGVLHAMNAESGEDAWTFRAGGAILHAAAVDGGRVFFGAADGKLYAVNAADGKLAWSVQTGSAIWNSPAVAGGLAIAGSRDGKVYACDAATGAAKWTLETGGPVLCSPAVDVKAGRVYIGSEDMCVYGAELTDGKLAWKSAKLPGASMRGYHPVIAPDGSVMVTVTPVLCADAIQPIMLDMVKEVFGDFASWRHKKEENDRLQRENIELMKKPETYPKQLDYLRKRLEQEPAYQTFFVLDPATGKQKFVTPLVYAESMNGPGSPALVTGEGKVIVKYSALLRSRYGSYSPFLNVGYLDTATGHIAPIMDQSRTYGWHDSLLLIHDEQSQLSVGGRMLFNTHQDNVNGMDLQTLVGYGSPMCNGIHEAKPGEAAGIWAAYLSGTPLPLGSEWFARGTAVYGGGSIIDVPIAIAGDSFYWLPTHELNAGCVVLAFRAKAGGKASERGPAPAQKLSDEQWKQVQAMKWDWDLLGMPRLNVTLSGLPGKMPGTRQAPLEDAAKDAVARITDGQLDEIIWQTPQLSPPQDVRANTANARRLEALAAVDRRLGTEVDELVSAKWRPLAFPAGKFPGEAYRFFADPSETLYTLALAYPHLPEPMREKARAHVAKLSEAGGPLAGPFGSPAYDPADGQVRSLYDPAPENLMRLSNDLVRSETARLYPLWLWAHVSGDWTRLQRDWPALKRAINPRPAKEELDCGNARLAGLIAACRIARKCGDEAGVTSLLPALRTELRARLVFELSHTEGGLIMPAPTIRTIFGRWRWLTPEVARLLQLHARPIHQRLMDVYVDHHRPTWWMAWNVELMWRNETNLLFPTAAMEVFSARALVLGEKPAELSRYVDLPWCRGDEYHIQKLALLAAGLAEWHWD